MCNSLETNLAKQMKIRLIELTVTPGQEICRIQQNSGVKYFRELHKRDYFKLKIS